MLKDLQGTFNVSLNAPPGVFETFKDFAIEKIDCFCTIADKGRGKQVREVVISHKL